MITNRRSTASLQKIWARLFSSTSEMADELPDILVDRDVDQQLDAFEIRRNTFHHNARSVSRWFRTNHNRTLPDRVLSLCDSSQQQRPGPGTKQWRRRRA
nr:hypothetical protein CFP56_50395 [Quercus suber]